MAFVFKFNEDKNQLLKATRYVGFDDILEAISLGGLLADISHHNRSNSNQRVYVVRIGRYAYAVPYVINFQKSEIYLKTVYPSRALTKKYIKGE